MLYRADQIEKDFFQSVSILTRIIRIEHEKVLETLSLVCLV